MDAILPAAGLASRMRGIPKFLLPCNDTYVSLVEVHIANLLEVCETVWIPTRPESVPLLASLGIAQERVVILPLTTATMTETVMRVINLSSAAVFQLVMPDTFFAGELPYGLLNRAPACADVACWPIRDGQRGKLGQVRISTDGRVLEMQDKDPHCPFPHAWGALTFSRALVPHMRSSDPHVGYALATAVAEGGPVTAFVVDGRYYDCGTPAEYLEMLNQAL